MANSTAIRDKLICVIVAIAVLIQLFLIALYVGPADCYPWSEFFTIWPAYFWALLLLPIVPLTFFAGLRRLALGMLFFIAVLAMQSNIVGTSFYDNSRKLPHAIRLISWNIGGPAPGGFPGILHALAQHQPDIVFFQESFDDDAASSDALSSVPYFAQFYMLNGGDCAILSRYPLKSLPTRSIGPWDKPTLAEVTIAGTSQPLVLCNVRMMLPSLALSPFSAQLISDHKQRLKQYELLYRLLAKTSESVGTSVPVVLAGDFNVCGGAQSLQSLKNSPLNLRDCWNAAGIGWGGTMPAELPMARIDQVWLTPNLQAGAVRVLGKMPSDHRPVCVDFAVLPN